MKTSLLWRIAVLFILLGLAATCGVRAQEPGQLIGADVDYFLAKMSWQEESLLELESRPETSAVIRAMAKDEEVVVPTEGITRTFAVSVEDVVVKTDAETFSFHYSDSMFCPRGFTASVLASDEVQFLTMSNGTGRDFYYSFDAETWQKVVSGQSVSIDPSGIVLLSLIDSDLAVCGEVSWSVRRHRVYLPLATN